MRTVVDVLILCVWDLGYVLSLIGMFLFMFTCLGMQLFGGELGDGADRPRGHWDNFPIALLTTFQVQTLDNWNGLLYEVAAIYGPVCWLWFGGWILLGTWILANILLVNILDAYSRVEGKIAEKESQLQLNADKKSEWHGEEVKPTGIRQRRKDAAQLKLDAPTLKQVRSRSLLENRVFEPVMIAIVLFNCYVVGLDKPWNDPESMDAQIVKWTSPLFTVLFLAETALKCHAYGVIGTENAYIDKTNPSGTWNRLDLLILVTCVLDHIAELVQLAEGEGRFFRMTRAFRVLRILSKVKGLQVLVVSILRSFVALSSVIGVTLLSWLVFGLTAVTYLKGRLYFCTDATGTSPIDEIDQIYGVHDCIGSKIAEFAPDQFGIAERSWAAPEVHFDRIDMAMYSLFELSSLNDWVITVRYAMDHVDVDKQPSRDFNKMWSFFFIFFIVINNFFLLNLFIGVIYTKYVAAKYRGIEDLSVRQEGWLATMKAIAFLQPVRAHAPTRPDRAAMHRIVELQSFEMGMMGVIIFNVVVLSLKYHGEPEAWTLMQDGFNEICTIVFTVEAGMKIWAYTFSGYWIEAWNRFDFVVVVASWLDIVVRVNSWDDDISPTPFRLLRVVRVAGRISRVFKLSKRFEPLRIIFDTFTSALPAMGYVTLLITVVLYVFGVIGMNLFGKVALQGTLPALGREAPLASHRLSLP
jgi:hypothetical protein